MWRCCWYDRWAGGYGVCSNFMGVHFFHGKNMDMQSFKPNIILDLNDCMSMFFSRPWQKVKYVCLILFKLHKNYQADSKINGQKEEPIKFVALNSVFLLIVVTICLDCNRLWQWYKAEARGWSCELASAPPLGIGPRFCSSPWAKTQPDASLA